MPVHDKTRKNKNPQYITTAYLVSSSVIKILHKIPSENCSLHMLMYLEDFKFSSWPTDELRSNITRMSTSSRRAAEQLICWQ